MTLFKSITGGLTWGDVAMSLHEVSPVFVLLFYGFISITVFLVLNTVTGMFVDGAIQFSTRERELTVEKEKETKEAYAQELYDLLVEIDTDNSGTITLDELENCLKDERLMCCFSALQIDLTEFRKLFMILDSEEIGCV